MEAKTVKVVADHYEADVMQKRNEYMVDHSDIVLAVWNGKKSGTENCIKYAEKMGKKSGIYRAMSHVLKILSRKTTAKSFLTYY